MENLHLWNRSENSKEFVCDNCHHSATYCQRFEIVYCPKATDPTRSSFISLGMPYGRGVGVYADFAKRFTASQTPLDVIRRRVGAVDCTLIETPLRNEISRVQGQLSAANAALASSNRAKDLLHKIIGSKREALNKVLSVKAGLRDQQQRRKSPWCHRFASECEGTLKHLGDLRSRLSVAEANLLCEQGAYRKIVGLRKDDITNYKKHTNDLKREIETLKEVVAIEQKHAAVLQKQFDTAIKQRDDHRAALTIQQSLAKDIIAAQQQTIANLREEVRNSRMANTYTPDSVPVEFPKHVGAVCRVVEPIAQADGVATNDGNRVSVKKYPGVLWATGEALNAQFKHGASVAEAQAYLDFCEANALTGPYYGYQQWKAIYLGASGKVV